MLIILTLSVFAAILLVSCAKTKKIEEPILIITPQPASPGAEETSEPAEIPTEDPVQYETEVPSSDVVPTDAPTQIPTDIPTDIPTGIPTEKPTEKPVETYYDHKELRTELVNVLKSSSVIPTVSIYTEGNQSVVSLEQYVRCLVDVFNCGDEYEITGSSAGIRVRGNSSAYFGDVEQILKNNAPYKIKFDVKTNMMGLNDGAKCKQWVLLKLLDWDIVRTDLITRLGRELIRGNAFCTDGSLIHLYINGKFMGNYQLCEQTQVNKHRINVNEPEEGYTGTDIGYLIELDNYAEAPFFRVSYNNKAVITDMYGESKNARNTTYSVKSDTYSQAQVDFAEKYMNNVYTVMYRACVEENYYTLDKDANIIESSFTSAEETVDAVIDIDSAVNMTILHEILCSCDNGSGSFFFSVDFSEGSTMTKLTFTAPWDFNWTEDMEPDSVFYAGAVATPEFRKEHGDRSNPWMVVLMGQDWFRERARNRLNELINNGTVASCIATERSLIVKYKNDLSKKYSNAYNSCMSIIDWIERRIDWLSKNL